MTLSIASRSLPLQQNLEWNLAEKKASIAPLVSVLEQLDLSRFKMVNGFDAQVIESKPCKNGKLECPECGGPVQGPWQTTGATPRVGFKSFYAVLHFR